MDSGRGTFSELDAKLAEAYLSGAKAKPDGSGGIFKVGETIEIRGSKFSVRKITKKDMILRLQRRV